LAICLTGLGVVSADSVTAKKLRWGEPVAGLQMAAMVEVPAGAVHCWIRNADNHTVTYNSYNLGDWSYVGIEVQDTRGIWTRLDRKPDSMRIYQGVGPTEHDIVSLAPLHVIPTCHSERSNVAGAVPAPANLGATLVLDLGDFKWPENILQQTKIEIRCVQGLAGPGMSNGVDGSYSPMFGIRSSTLQLDGATMRSFLDQYHRDAGKILK
jgi:hypothetical protein